MNLWVAKWTFFEGEAVFTSLLPQNTFSKENDVLSANVTAFKFTPFKSLSSDNDKFPKPISPGACSFVNGNNNDANSKYCLTQGVYLSAEYFDSNSCGKMKFILSQPLVK